MVRRTAGRTTQGHDASHHLLLSVRHKSNLSLTNTEAPTFTGSKGLALISVILTDTQEITHSHDLHGNKQPMAFYADNEMPTNDVVHSNKKILLE